MNATTTTEAPDPIAAKEAEIKNYRRILDNYRGRWYDSGRRHLVELENELEALKAAAQRPARRP